MRQTKKTPKIRYNFLRNSKNLISPSTFYKKNDYISIFPDFAWLILRTFPDFSLNSESICDNSDKRKWETTEKMWKKIKAKIKREKIGKQKMRKKGNRKRAIKRRVKKKWKSEKKKKSEKGKKKKNKEKKREGGGCLRVGAAWVRKLCTAAAWT